MRYKAFTILEEHADAHTDRWKAGEHSGNSNLLGWCQHRLTGNCERIWKIIHRKIGTHKRKESQKIREKFIWIYLMALLWRLKCGCGFICCAFVLLCFATGSPYLLEDSFEFTLQPTLAWQSQLSCLNMLSAGSDGYHYWHVCH